MFVDYLKLMRIPHWIKNLFIFVPLVFSMNFLAVPLILRSLYTFAAFCLVSSSVYILNDLIDRDKDKLHPLKKHRPLASGKVSPALSIALAALLFLGGLAVTIFINLNTVLAFSGYFAVTLLYSLALKNQVILDVFLIAFGFVLRVIAGAAAIDVAVSNWLFLTTLFISLFIGYGKRRHELVILEESSHKHRPVLKDYNVRLLDYMIVIAVTLTIITFSLYVIDPDTIQRFGTRSLLYTLPFVLYGMFRYMYDIYGKGEGGDPADIVIRDKHILIDVALCGILILVILYFKL
ncbi:MAG: hypothetical protein A2Y33_13120 [Spirochaetes bacterium GWF1_51_8]|nr:MAG: hypothetical protein A2Y33_13120 [Spirochaetes bacterium GWF1_51_8]